MKIQNEIYDFAVATKNILAMRIVYMQYRTAYLEERYGRKDVLLLSYGPSADSEKMHKEYNPNISEEQKDRIVKILMHVHNLTSDCFTWSTINKLNQTSDIFVKSIDEDMNEAFEQNDFESVKRFTEQMYLLYEDFKEV